MAAESSGTGSATEAQNLGRVRHLRQQADAEPATPWVRLPEADGPAALSRSERRRTIPAFKKPSLRIWQRSGRSSHTACP